MERKPAYPVCIFDFGNVIARFDPAYLTSGYVTDPSDAALVREVLFDRRLWDPLDAGTITDGEVKSAAKEKLPTRLWDASDEIYDHWVENLPLIGGMPELIAELKASGCRLYLLSNISIGFSEKWKDVPELRRVLTAFDGLVFSGPIHLVKPSHAIFEYLTRRYSLDPAQCAFIDDSPRNITGADAFGIHGILFDGNAEALSRKLFLS